jgi:HD-GYP domain-containing protein (c-di-GMP phosphodiesterase class II)
MVKLADLIKKSKEELSPAAVQPQKSIKEMLEDIENVYELLIFQTKQFMDDIMLGKPKEWEEIVQNVGKLLEAFIVKPEIFMSRVNKWKQSKDVSNYFYPHCVNAAILAANMGTAMNLPKSDIIVLSGGALIHDIGMLNIPLELINAPRKLTDEEYAEIKRHPAYGLTFLSRIKEAPKAVAEIIYQHHENVDGTGYPEGKKNEEISLFAKIVSLVEVYEAITHYRPYRQGQIIPFEAIKMIILQSESKFDRSAMKALLDYITFYPIGSYVVLNNDEIGRVVDINNAVPTRPIIEIFLDHKGGRLAKPRKVDLLKSNVLYIKKAINGDSLKESS